MATGALISEWEKASGFVRLALFHSWEIENQNVGTFNRELDPITRHAIRLVRMRWLWQELASSCHRMKESKMKSYPRIVTIILSRSCAPVIRPRLNHSAGA